MASSAETGLQSKLGVSLSGISQECSLFTSLAWLPALGLLLPSVASVFPHFLEVNYCSWVLHYANQNIVPTLQLVNKGAAAGTLKKSRSPALEAVPGKKKRGRKPLRPQDPVRKKTEQKDKYWFRTFRAYMRQHYSLLSPNMTPQDQFFWGKYLSLDGRPSKGRQFASYSKEYKNYLFRNATFQKHFEQWFGDKGAAALSEKYSRDSALWFVFYDYAASELVTYKSLHSL